MSEESVLTQEMRDLIDVESAPVVYEVEKTGIRMFARAVGYTDPVFYDEAEAQRRGYRSLLAPPGYLGTRIFQPAAGDATGGRLFVSPYKRNLNGGTEVEYYGDVCAGDVLAARAKLASLTETRGSLGPMLIAVTETGYVNQDGKLVAKTRGTGISY